MRRKVLEEKVEDSIPPSVPTESVPEKLSALVEDPIITSFKDLQDRIRKVRDQGVTLEDAERLAARFLDVLIEIGGPNGTLHLAEWDAKSKKNAWKTWRSKVYLSEIIGKEKKPTEAAIEAAIVSNTDVCKAQDAYEKAETYAESLHRVYEVFRDSHIYFRGIARNAGSSF